jgi:hypothetical protein
MAPIPDVRRMSLVKPSIQTRFHIDFAWWGEKDRDWRVYLHSLLCPEHQAMFIELSSDNLVDFVDPATAEVQRVDGLQHVLISHCARQSGFITTHTTIVDAVFRTFLANGNTPMTPTELAVHLNRSPELILRTLTGERVYRGLRPKSEP